MLQGNLLLQAKASLYPGHLGLVDVKSLLLLDLLHLLQPLLGKVGLVLTWIQSRFDQEVVFVFEGDKGCGALRFLHCLERLDDFLGTIGVPR